MTVRVAVVGGRAHAVMYARELDVEVVLVHGADQHEPAFDAFCKRIVHADITDAEAIFDVLAPLHAQRPFARVITTSEDGAVATAVVAERLGLSGNSVESARALKDKALTRAAVRDDAAAVRYAVAHSADELVAFQAAVGGPVVVKPTDGTASAHVHVVREPAQATVAWERLDAAGRTPAIAEEFLDGPVISVESFSSEGRHLVLGYTEYILNRNLVEVGFKVPSPLALAHDEELRRQIAALLDAVGLLEGPSHTEFVITERGPRLLESHSRMAGGGVPELIRRAYGRHQSRWFLSVTLGLEKLPDESPTPVGGSALRFLEPAPGIVADLGDGAILGVPVTRIPRDETVIGIPRLEDVMDQPAAVVIQVNEGDEVPEIRIGWDRRMGYVVVSDRDAEAAARRCKELHDAVRIRTVPAA